MNVVFSIERFYPNASGATYAALNMAHGLRDQGVAVSFIVHDVDGTYTSGGEYEGFPIQAFSTGGPGKLKRIRGFLSFFAYTLRQRHTFDVFHIHGVDYITLLQGFWVAVVLRKPTVLKVTSAEWDSPQGIQSARYGNIAWWMYCHIPCAVVMTSGQEAQLRAADYPGRIARIPNGVDCSRFYPREETERRRLRQELSLPLHLPLILYAGVLSQGKGADILFHTWHTLLSRGLRVGLICVGDFEHNLSRKEMLEQYLRNHGIDPSLAEHTDLFLVERTERIDDYFSVADLFIFPSRSEGFGTVQIEAMACGLPCIVNDLPGSSADIFPCETFGFRIPENNIIQFADSAEKLLGSNELRHKIGVAACQRAQDSFSIQSITTRLLGLYQDLRPHKH